MSPPETSRVGELRENSPPSPPSSSTSGAGERSSRPSEIGSDINTNAIQPPKLRLENGILLVDNSGSPHVATILDNTLGRPPQEYVTHEPSNPDQDQWLLDKKGRIFQISTYPKAGMIALHSSTPQLNPTSPPGSIKAALLESGNPPAAKNYLAVATGVYQDNNGEHWRIADGQLYRLTGIGVWKEAKKEQAGVTELSGGADNGVYGLKDGNKIINVGNDQTSKPQERSISAYAVSQGGQVALLLNADNDDQPASLRLLPSLLALPEQTTNLTPRYAGNAGDTVADLTSLGFSDKALFATDNENRVLMAPLPQPGQSELRFSVMPQYDLEKAFGNDMQAEGFTSDNSGRLSLLVKDNANQQHACPLIESGKTFRPGWNLSDILHIDNTMGLETLQESGLYTQEFGPLGSFTVANGKLYYKDQLTQQWRKAADHVESLQRGLDGQPYVLQEGKVKQLGVDHRSATIGYGDNNVFALTRSRGKPNLDKSPAGVPEGEIKAAAMLNSNQHVVLNVVLARENDVDVLKYNHIRPLSGKPMHPAVAIPTNGIEGEIRHLAVDQDQNLYALTQEGKLFSLPDQQWKKPIVDRNIQWNELPPPFPADQMATGQLSLSEDFRLEISTNIGERFIRQGDGWESPQTKADENHKTGRDVLFDNLTHANKRFKRKGGIIYQVTGKVGNVEGMETRKIGSKFTDRLRAHCFDPSLKTPRPLKTAAYGIQHKWQGRDGLSKLYEQEHGLYKELESRNTLINAELTPARPAGLDIKTRLERLDLGEAGKELKATIETFLGNLEKSAERRLTELGKHQGVLDAHGQVNRNYKPSKLKDAVQSMNPNRSGHSLSQELLTHWKHAPASAESKVEKLLQDFTDLNVNMSHEKTEIPLGRRRDPSDQMALCKARLVLDTLALKRVDDLVDKAEMLAGTQPNEQQIISLLTDLSQVRDVFYENSKVKYYTDKGMNSHRDAENGYDALKSFVKALGNREHGVNLITGAALQTEDQAQLNATLKEVLHSLKVDDNITITRGYAANVGGYYIPYIDALVKTLALTPDAKIQGQSHYEMELNGLGDGIQCVVKRKRGVDGAVGIGAYREFIEDKTSDNNPGRIAAYGDIKASGGYMSGNEVVFSIRGENINKFVDGLTSGLITPEELMDLGTEHMTVNGGRYDFNVDIGAYLITRLQRDTDNKKDGDPNILARINATATIGANLMSINKEQLIYRNEANSRERITSRTGVLNKVNAEAGFALGLGMSDKIGSEPADARNGEEITDDRHGHGYYPSIQTGATVTVDNTIMTRGELKTKQAQPISASDMGKLCDKLSGAFHDHESRQIVKGVRSLPDTNEQLKILKTHFLDSGTIEARNDTQYLALRAIESTSVQHLAATNGIDMVADIKAVVSHSNPSHLDSPGVVAHLTSLVAPSRQKELSQKIAAMMKEDPSMARILKQVSSVANCYTWVTLELKDEPRRQIEEKIAKGESTIEDARKILQKPENRRIRSIAILEMGQHNEGFTAPTPVFSGNSKVGIYMERFACSVNFKYGRDQDIPRNYDLTGNIVSAEEDITAHAAAELQKEGLDIADNTAKSPKRTN